MVARVEGLDRLADVSQDHLPVLRTMHDVGTKWVQTFLKENQSLTFRLGYHSVCVALLLVLNVKHLLVYSCMKQKGGIPAKKL